MGMIYKRGEVFCVITAARARGTKLGCFPDGGVGWVAGRVVLSRKEMRDRLMNRFKAGVPH